ncbi:MAG TPA: hypothetical protein VGM17_02020 [Rhizomicrobium sp.]|jgi:hypothetical protein
MSEVSATAFVERRNEARAAFARAWRLPVAAPTWEAAAIAVLIPMLLVAALWNGFPLMFYDTGAYIFQGFTGRFVPERSPVYSLFLWYAGAGVTIWSIAIVQAVITAFVVVETARAVAPHIALGTVLAIGGALTILTGLPWYVGEAEPDCFTALLVLSLYLLAFHSQTLGRWRALALFLIAVLSVGVHPSHLGLAAGLVILTALYTLFVRRPPWPRPKLLLPCASIVLSLTLTLGANFHYTRHIFISRAGGVFAMARMMQDGIVTKVLDETCAAKHFDLCPYRDTLPTRADQYLWGPKTPFNKLGRFTKTEKESDAIVRESLWRYPWLNLEMAAKDAVEQFVIFHTGDGIDPQQWIIGRDFRIFMPSQLPAYGIALQQKGGIPFRAINFLHLPVAWLGLVLLIAGFLFALGKSDCRTAVLFGFVLAALMGNAMICGVLSGPHARYQSRLIWTPILALALVGSSRLALRQE